MKKLISLLLFSAALAAVLGQDPGIKALYLAYQPADHGLGLRTDYQIGNIGFYNSLTYGKWGLYRLMGIAPHSKLTFGLRIPLRQTQKDCRYNISAGVNYHNLQSTARENPQVDPRIFNPWSFELGTSLYLGRFAIAVRTDILRWEPCVDIGYFIKGQKQNSYQKKKWKHEIR